MKAHNYGFDINCIISKANEQCNSPVEAYALNLDNFLSNQDKFSPEMTEIVEMTINLLYELIHNKSNSECDCHQYR